MRYRPSTALKPFIFTHRMYCLWKYLKFLSFLLFQRILETEKVLFFFVFYVCLFLLHLLSCLLKEKREEKGIKWESSITNWPAILQGFLARKLFFSCQQKLTTFQKWSKGWLISEVLILSSCTDSAMYTATPTKVSTPQALGLLQIQDDLWLPNVICPQNHAEPCIWPG